MTVIQEYAYFFGSGIVGASLHYVKKYYIDLETSEPFFKWFGSSHLKSTLVFYGTFIGAAVTALQSGIITEATPIITILYSGYLTGYASDGLNKDQAQADAIKAKKEIKIEEDAK